MSISQRFRWGLMTFLSLGVGAYGFFLVVTGFAHVPAEVSSNGFFSPAGLQVHIAASALALTLGMPAETVAVILNATR